MNGTVPIEPDYRFSDAVDNRFNIFFGLDNVSQRALPIFRQAFRHPVERGGNFGKLLVIAQVESLFVIVVGNLQDPVGQLRIGDVMERGKRIRKAKAIRTQATAIMQIHNNAWSAVRSATLLFR